MLPGPPPRHRRVGLAGPPAGLPVRAARLDDLDPGPAQEPGQARAAGAGALHPDPGHRPEPGQPAQQVTVPGRGGRELRARHLRWSLSSLPLARCQGMAPPPDSAAGCDRPVGAGRSTALTAVLAPHQPGPGRQIVTRTGKPSADSRAKPETRARPIVLLHQPQGDGLSPINPSPPLPAIGTGRPLSTYSLPITSGGQLGLARCGVARRSAGYGCCASLDWQPMAWRYMRKMTSCMSPSLTW